jgi:hypothetical protein
MNGIAFFHLSGLKEGSYQGLALHQVTLALHQVITQAL